MNRTVTFVRTTAVHHRDGDTVREARTGPVIGLIAQLALLAALAGAVGVGAAGWVVGVYYG